MKFTHMKAPVVIFVYNRAEHTKKTLEALNDNRMAGDTQLYIFADNAKNEKAVEGVRATRKVIDEFARNNNFKQVNIIKSEVNKGLAKSILSGVTSVIKEHGKVIVVEDDLITSKDFLEFMNGALDYYEAKKNIWSISGYTPYLTALKKYSKDVYTCYRASSWGWATWLDRWESVDWDVKDYEEFVNSDSMKAHFNKGGSDLSGMLVDWHEKKNNSWAIRWCYQQSKDNKLTIYPKESRVTNNGCDDSGTHSGRTTRYDTPFEKDHKACNFEDINISEKIMSEYRLVYDFSRIGRIKRKLLWLIYGGM